MNKLLNLLTGLLTLKQGPQDAPSQPLPFLIAYVVTGFAQMSALNLAGQPAAVLVVGETVLLCAAVMIFLQVLGKPARWSQTITALCLGGTFFNLLAMLVASLLPIGTAASPNPLTAIVSVVLMIWYFAFAGGVIRHAGEVPLALAVGLMVAYQLVVMTILPWPGSIQPPTSELSMLPSAITPSTAFG